MAKRSYIKIYGPPIYDAIKALEKLAFDNPKVCIMDTILVNAYPSVLPSQSMDVDAQVQTDSMANVAINYFGGVKEISYERCANIISKSGEELGDYDFYFEWFRTPTHNELSDFIKKVDETIKNVGCIYTITTK